MSDSSVGVQPPSTTFYVRLDASSDADVIAGPLDRGTEPEVLADRFRLLNTFVDVVRPFVGALGYEFERLSGLLGPEAGEQLRNASVAPFGRDIRPIIRRDRSPQRVNVAFATYQNPLEVWLTFLGSGVGLHALAGSFVKIATLLRDWGTDRELSQTRVNVARLQARDLEGAIELREAMRERLMQDMKLANPGIPVNDLDWDGLVAQLVNLDTAGTLLALSANLDGTAIVDDVGARPTDG